MSGPRWLESTEVGLRCVPADVWVDPLRPVERAIVTHGHADHARPGHGAVLATPDTLAILALRHGDRAARPDPLPYGEARALPGGVRVTLLPAGHVLGSAVVLLERAGERVLISGDLKRQADPSCAPLELVPAHTLILEATFALPVFRFPPIETELARLLASVAAQPQRAHLIGVYALGKAQRVLAELRRLGWDRPVPVHGALEALCALYEARGVPLGPRLAATELSREALAGEIVLAPPVALSDRWSRRLPDPVRGLASGWMRVRARARQRRVNLPLVISDHADWPGLLSVIDEVGPERVWVTHGREEALVHHCRARGLEARALALHGYEEDAE